LAEQPLDPAARLEALDQVMNALAHPARRHILLVVRFRGGEVSAGDIAARFAHAWPTTTRHLRVLEAAGLLTQERRGRQRVYKLDTDRLMLVQEYLAWLTPVGPTAPPSPSPRRGASRT
jgi:DNA-binding transcriptional ArsR family regulator